MVSRQCTELGTSAAGSADRLAAATVALLAHLPCILPCNRGFSASSAKPRPEDSCSVTSPMKMRALKGEETRSSGSTAAEDDSAGGSPDLDQSPSPPSGLPGTMQEALRMLAVDLCAAAKQGSVAEMTVASWQQVGAAPALG